MLISDVSYITDAHGMASVIAITANNATGTVDIISIWTAHFFPTWNSTVFKMLVWTTFVDGTFMFGDADTSVGRIVTVIHSFEAWNAIACFMIDTAISNRSGRTGGTPAHDFMLRTAWLATSGAYQFFIFRTQWRRITFVFRDALTGAVIPGIAFYALTTRLAHFRTLLVFAVAPIIGITAVSFATATSTFVPFLTGRAVVYWRCNSSGNRQGNQAQNELKVS